jgi:hypothetical protein
LGSLLQSLGDYDSMRQDEQISYITAYVLYLIRRYTFDICTTTTVAFTFTLKTWQFVQLFGIQEACIPPTSHAYSVWTSIESRIYFSIHQGRYYKNPIGRLGYIGVIGPMPMPCNSVLCCHLHQNKPKYFTEWLKIRNQDQKIQIFRHCV